MLFGFVILAIIVTGGTRKQLSQEHFLQHMLDHTDAQMKDPSRQKNMEVEATPLFKNYRRGSIFY